MPGQNTPRTKSAGRKRGGAPSLTTADLVVLSLLSEREVHGYELLQEYERQEVSEWATVSRAHVYYALKKLAVRGLIALAESPGGEGRDRAVYRVTADGRDALSESLGNLAWATAKSPLPFTTWLGLALHTSLANRQRVIAARLTFLEAEQVKKRKALAFIQTYASPRAAIGLQMVEFYIQQLEQEHAWLQTLNPEAWG